jgi:flagellin-like hook-associated protein FlgL
MTSYEVQNLFNELIDIGNTKLKNRYIFSGYLTDTRAYSTVGAYQGDSNNISTYISEGITSKINVTGDSAFSDSTKYISDDLTSETLTGSLSIVTGSNNAVIIPGSAYAFAAATPEAIRDTINAPMSDWYATAATTVGAGTLRVKIGNTDPVNVTVAAADTVSDVVTALNAVTGLTAGLAYETTEAAGSRVKIFIRPTTSGDPVSIEIASDADLDDNDDNGLSALLHTDVKSNLTENAIGIEAMVINDSSTKRLLFDPVVANTTYTIAVDEDGDGTFSEAAEIDTTGLSQLYHVSSATTNLNNSISFHMVLDHLRISMANNDSIGIRQSIKLLDGSMDGLLNVTADVGSRYKYLEDQKNRLEDNTLSYRQNLSSLEDADIAEVAMKITKIQTALEAMRISSMKSLQQSLFDFLR